MHEPLRTLAPDKADQADRRRVPRHLGSATATLQRDGHGLCTARITDVSAYGCSVEAIADWVRPGCFVAVAVNGGEPVEAVVRWSREGTAGLELLRPLAAECREWHALID